MAMSADGSNKRQLTNNGASNFAPFLHPDNQTVIFSSNLLLPGSRYFELYTVPLPGELANCRPYFERELELLRPRAILALGGIAMRAYLSLLKERGVIQSLAAFPFRHGASYQLPGELPRLFVSYHPSQQNTFTGKLTEAMFFRVLGDIRRFLRG
jgi:uracil-DNA glycosylase